MANTKSNRGKNLTQEMRAKGGRNSHRGKSTKPAM